MVSMCFARRVTRIRPVYVGVSDFRLAEPGGGEAGGFGEREAETQKLKIEDRGPRTD